MVPIEDKRPRFTVAIPTHNRADRFLPEAIQAVLRQTFDDFELIVSDNGSSDNTTQYVRSIADPRLRYIRHEPTIPVGEHFAALCAEARGQYLVLHQDDDLLHHQFLERADAAFALHPEANIYACPIWRQQHGHGYHSRLLRPEHGHEDVLVASDELLIFDGNYAAIQLFDPIRHFLHPTLAMKTDALVAVGGFDPGIYQSDLLTQARLLFGNKMLYDPRPGGVSRVHPSNFMRTKGRGFRKQFFRNSYVVLIAAFEKAGVSWQDVLSGYLSKLTEKEVLGCLYEWVYYRAPLELQEIGFNALKNCTGSRKKFYRRCLAGLGVRNLARYAVSRANSHAN